jgi:predicted solute-binding protein
VKSLRIGCVKYLNARPLIHGWPGEVTFDHPSALCRSLARGELDVALVSSFEFLRNPIYRIVDGISISSDGPVYSVVVAHQGKFSQLREIDLDPAAETSVNLLQCLLAESGLTPRLVNPRDRNRADKQSDSNLQDSGLTHARLLIGDQAIQFRKEQEGNFIFWDLGEQWHKLVHLPFVYAFWLVRPEVTNPGKIADQLRAVRDENLSRLDSLIGEQENPAFCARYYREYLRFNFGTAEKKGLRMFQMLCEKHRLIRRPPAELALV